MPTKTDIANLAISHLGIGKTISNIDSDSSAEAKAVRTFYETARDSLIEWAPWPFAKKQSALGLVSNDPSTGFAYAYAYPSTAVRFLRIVPYATQGDIANDQEIVFRIYNGTAGSEIWTNEADAIGEYIESVDDTTRYTANFTMALSYLLGSMIAPRISGGDNMGLSNRVMQLFQIARGMAATVSFNEEKRGEPPDPEFVRARI